MLWDIFCRVVDNLGDIGVCWRLATNLAQRGHRVRLWVDDASALRWMAPGALEGTVTGIEVHDWAQTLHTDALRQLAPSDVWVETFGCTIATNFIAARAHSICSGGLNGTENPAWINLEYLTAEDYAKRSHTLTSPVMSGPAQGWAKHFFYPGFKPGTGGLLREPDLATRQAAFNKKDWLLKQGIEWHGERLVSLFCYEPTALPQLLAQLQSSNTPTRLLVTHGRASDAVRRLSPQCGVQYLPLLNQVDFDHLLWACDFNCVRGEDSLVRALWSGKPFVWQIYQQDDNAHHDKLHAFLDTMHISASLRLFHQVWNDIASNCIAQPLPALDLDAWQPWATANRDRLLEQDDLVTQLVEFVQKKR
jgi:uncharacterized repeat protein (TIGR03837 family)